MIFWWIYIIHNASRPRRPHLWIRVLVCPWEALLNRVNTILDRLAFGHKLFSIVPKCHQDGTRIQSKYHANHTMGHPWAGSERQVANRRHVAANGGHMDPNRDPPIGVCCIKFWQFLDIFSHLILDVIHDTCSKDCHILQLLLVTILHTCVWRFSNN